MGMYYEDKQENLCWGTVGFLAISLAACGSSNNSNTSEPSSSLSAASPSASVSAEPTKENVTITFQNIYPDPSDPKYK
jgi:raffinose/stachyose/melibiose transport system substrate-binding protein